MTCAPRSPARRCVLSRSPPPHPTPSPPTLLESLAIHRHLDCQLKALEQELLPEPFGLRPPALPRLAPRQFLRRTCDDHEACARTTIRVAAEQLDFARAYDIVLHTWIWRAMVKRGVPPVLALASLCEARQAEMYFPFFSWSASLTRVGVAMRQGCSASPMLLLWVLSDSLEVLAAKLEAQGQHFHMQSDC